MTPITTLIVSLVTILMSGVVASVVTFKLNARHQRINLMRSKAEELFSAFHEYCNGLRGHFLTAIPMLSGRVNQDQFNQMTFKNLAECDSAHFRNVEMLVGIYFPELQTELDSLKGIRDGMNNVLSQHRRDPAIGKDLVGRFQKDLSALSRQEKEFKNTLVNLTRRL